LSSEKGILPLTEAYAMYSREQDNPWPLIIAGTGPLSAELQGRSGVDCRGFVQPSQLPDVYADAGCLILPSSFEPWGVVIHEATAAGLPVICTTSCGAGVHLVQDHYNGYVVEPNNPTELAQAMARYGRLSEQRRREMSAASYSLSLQFTPQRWAQTVLERAAELRQRPGAHAAQA
jgi:glycosyltransferase involved in cell wall biosynthesis